MARSRNIKPGFFTNDVLGELPPLARLLFAGMWCHADREGRLLDRPKKLKAEILPYDECDIERLVQCLHDAGMVLRYVVENVGYIQVLTFLKHQNPHIKEGASTIPAPDKNGALPVLAREIPERAGLIPDSLNPHTDSLNLIPDSLKPKPVKVKNNTRPADAFIRPDDCPESAWRDWMTARKAKRLPNTETAWQAFKRECDVAGLTPADAVKVCAERGWGGFRASYMDGSAIGIKKTLHDNNKEVLDKWLAKKRLEAEREIN